MTQNLVEDNDVAANSTVAAREERSTPMRRHRRWPWSLGVALTALALMAGGAAWKLPQYRVAVIAALQSPGQGKTVVSATPRPPIVRTAIAVAALGHDARYTGVVHARYESALGFRVAGKIIVRLVDTGERVHKDQPLMRLDPTDLDLALRAARSEVEAARATAAQTAADEARQRALVEKDQASRQVYERGKAASDAAGAKLVVALAQEHQAQNQASYAVLLADADGVVMETFGEPGQVVSAGQPVVRLARDGAREAEVYIPDGEKAAVTGSAALYANRLTRFPAKLREISASADSPTRTFRARYVLAGEGRAAPLGATVTIRLPKVSGEQAGVMVPVGALFDQGDGANVWVIDRASTKVTARAVRILHIGDEDADVAGDLRPGERVVALGAHLLQADEKVGIDRVPTDTAAR